MANKSFFDSIDLGDEEGSEASVTGKLNALRKMVGKKEQDEPKRKTGFSGYNAKKSIPNPDQEDVKVIETALPNVSTEMATQLVEFLSELSNRLSEMENNFAGRDAKISQIGNKFETFKNLNVSLDLTNLERVAHLLENTEVVCSERMKHIMIILNNKRDFLKKGSYIGYAEILEQTLKEDALMFDRILSHKSSERNELDMYVRKTQDKFNAFEN